MNIENMVSEFMSSSVGAEAKAALSEQLAGQGVSAGDAHQMLQHAAKAAGDHMEHHHGLLGDHPGRSFFAAFAAGLIKGDGIMDALGDGMEGVIAARISEAIMDKMGVESGVAETAAAAAAPFLISFLKEKISG